MDRKSQIIEFKERFKREDLATTSPQKKETSFSLIRSKKKAKSIAGRREESQGEGRIIRKKLGMLAKENSHPTMQSFGEVFQSFNTNCMTKTANHPRTNSTTNISRTFRAPNEIKGNSFVLGSRKSSGQILSQYKASLMATESMGTTRTVTPQLRMNSSRNMKTRKELESEMGHLSRQKSILVEKRSDF